MILKNNYFRKTMNESSYRQNHIKNQTINDDQ